MNFNKLLPIPKGESVSAWQETWLKEVCTDVHTYLTVDNLDDFRNRNERLSSYMATITTLMAAHDAHMNDMRERYERDNPRPETGEKGITTWKEGERAFLRRAQSDYTFLEGLHNDINVKLSQSQTALRTKADEVKRL